MGDGQLEHWVHCGLRWGCLTGPVRTRKVSRSVQKKPHFVPNKTLNSPKKGHRDLTDRQNNPLFIPYKSRLRLGLCWVLVLLNALEITMQERLLALQMCFQHRDDCPDTRLIFTSKLTSAWHHRMAHA